MDHEWQFTIQYGGSGGAAEHSLQFGREYWWVLRVVDFHSIAGGHAKFSRGKFFDRLLLLPGQLVFQD